MPYFYKVSPTKKVGTSKVEWGMFSKGENYKYLKNFPKEISFLYLQPDLLF